MLLEPSGPSGKSGSRAQARRAWLAARKTAVHLVASLVARRSPLRGLASERQVQVLLCAACRYGLEPYFPDLFSLSPLPPLPSGRPRAFPLAFSWKDTRCAILTERLSRAVGSILRETQLYFIFFMSSRPSVSSTMPIEST
jgi:hypothetical protein